MDPTAVPAADQDGAFAGTAATDFRAADRDLARRAERERTLREIVGRMAATRDPDALLRQVVAEATRLVRADATILALIEADGHLHWRLDNGLHERFAPEFVAGLTLEIGFGVTGRAVAANEVLIRNRDLISAFPRSPESDHFFAVSGARAMIAAPITGADGPVGALEVYAGHEDAFDAADAELMRAFADHAAVAIANARLIDDLARSRAELARSIETERALREIGAGMTRLGDPVEMLQKVVDETARLLDSDGAHLTIRAEAGPHLVPIVATGGDAATRAWLQTLEFPLHAGLNGLAATEGRAVRSDDYLVDPRIPHEPSDQEVALRLGLRGVAIAPLCGPGGGVLGTLAISYARPRVIAPEEIALLESLADQAAIVVANARLYERLLASEERYRHLVATSPDIVWAIDAEGRFTFLSDRLQPLTGFRADDLVGRSFGDLVDPAEVAAARATWEALRVDPDAVHTLPIRIPCADGSAVPVEVRAVGSVRDGAFAGAHGSMRDMRERLRLERDIRLQASAIASNEERAHLARELHDSVTQALFSMTLVTRSIELLMDGDPAGARARLATLRELQRDALAEMRALIFELRPASLETEGLVAALRTHAAAVQGRTGLPIVLDLEDGERLAGDVEAALYRVAQEALHNVVKHAAARSVRLALRRSEVGARGSTPPAPVAVALEVEDDGVGFDPAQVPDGHLGLAGMRARLEKLGGSVTIGSGSGGRGTCVRGLVPLEG